MLVAAPAGAQSTQSKSAQKPQHKMQHKPQAMQKKQGGPMRGKLEKLECKLGSEDRHARIAVELIGGRQIALTLPKADNVRKLQVNSARAQSGRSRELPTRLTPEEREAHEKMVSSLGAAALWKAKLN